MNCQHCGEEIDEGTTCECCQVDFGDYPSDSKLEWMEENDEQTE